MAKPKRTSIKKNIIWTPFFNVIAGDGNMLFVFKNNFINKGGDNEMAKDKGKGTGGQTIKKGPPKTIGTQNRDDKKK